jgi:hypothetical protein
VSTNVNYRKLRDGSWGVGGPAHLVRAGATVAVTKADGTIKQETVSRIVAGPFGDGNVLASIAVNGNGATKRTTTTTKTKRECRRCGCDDPTCGGSGRGICRGPSFDPCHDCV